MVYLFLMKKCDDLTTDEAVLMLAREYCALAEIPEGDFTIARTEKGKPYFLNNNSVHFSVSHSGGILLVLFRMR